MIENPFSGGSPFDDEVLARTRRGLHQLAEHVLAADLHRHTGRIGLRPTPGGIGTPVYIADGVSRQARVEGDELVLVVGDEWRRSPITTVADAASFLDVVPGAVDVYEAVTPLEPDRPLQLDDAASRALADWLAVGEEALERFAARHGGAEPTAAQLWPEHFDLAISMGTANYGVSSGDDDHLLPYAYVGPWNVPDGAGQSGEWWNQPFGRAVSAVDLRDGGDVTTLFEDGWAQLS